jgi:hypothetical protein
MNRPSTALVPQPADAIQLDDVRLQQMWIAVQRRRWRSLAILAAGAGIPTLPTANLLAKIAWAYSGQPSAVFDLRDVSLRLLEHQIQNVQLQVTNGERVFVALRSTSENPTAIALARTADAVLLCVTLGDTKTKAASDSIESVGRDRFVGCVVVDPEPRAT